MRGTHPLVGAVFLAVTATGHPLVLYVSRLVPNACLSVIFHSSMVGTPMFVGVADEVGIEVARIARHFAPKPRRRLDALGFSR